MIISHKYKFIFIKTKKTAGTSIEIFLSQLCGDSDVVTPIWPHVEPHIARNYQGVWNPFPEIIQNKGRNIEGVISKLLRRNKFYSHIPARVVKARISQDIWDTYYKFCVERNPWDNTLSDYHMQKARSEDGLTLDEYIDKGHYCFNFPHYCDSQGNLLVDKVIKYESLMEELAEVFGRLAIPFHGDLGVRAKSDYRSERRSYRETLTGRQREVIEKAYAREIEMNGYTF